MASSGSFAPSFTTNANQLTAKLNRMAGTIEDPRVPLEGCKRLIQQQEEEVWASQGEILGDHWNAAVQPERKTSSELLVATGALRNSMTSESSGRIRGATLRYGTRLYYGRFHQYGTVKMDARPFTGLSTELRREIATILENATGQALLSRDEGGLV
jgi:phage gpG-like protein